MITIINTILTILFIIAIISFVIVFIFIATYKLQSTSSSNILCFLLKNNIYFKFSIILTIFSFLSIFGLNVYVNKLSRVEIIEKIENLKDSNFKLYINNLLKEDDSLINALKKIEKKTNLRNIGSKEINIQIKNKTEVINLKLLRDFQIKTKYWVFYENYTTTSKNCIGEVNTNSLNEYK